MLSAADVIRLLELEPHPEGGHYRQTFRDSPHRRRRRAASTAIYYLLARGERSHWHRVDVVEGWHWYAGAALSLQIARRRRAHAAFASAPISPPASGPQAIVPAGAWQAAESLGDWTLCGCTVAPGFEFSRFELAPELDAG